MPTVKAGTAEIEVTIDRTKFNREWARIKREIEGTQASIGTQAGRATGVAGVAGTGVAGAVGARGGALSAGIGAGVGTTVATGLMRQSNYKKDVLWLDIINKKVEGILQKKVGAREVRMFGKGGGEAGGFSAIFPKDSDKHGIFIKDLKEFMRSNVIPARTKALTKLKVVFSDLGAGIQGIANKFSGLGKSLAGFITRATSGIPIIGSLTAALGGLGLALVGSILVVGKSMSVFSKTQREALLLAKAIRASGGAAGFTARQLDDMSKQLAFRTMFDDSQIKDFQRILLSFVKVTGDEFERATKLGLDLSIMMRQDLRTSAIQLGKVLQDPVGQLGALTRSGVSFTKQEKEKIKSLVQSNKLLEAQRMIMQLIEDQGVKGLAVRDVDSISDSWGEFKDQFGRMVASVGEGFAEMTGWARVLWGLASAFNGVATTIEKTVDKMRVFIGWNRKLITSIVATQIQTAELAASFMPGGDSPLKQWKENIDTMKSIWSDTVTDLPEDGKKIKKPFDELNDTLDKAIEKIKTLNSATAVWARAQQLASSVTGAKKTENLGLLGRFLNNPRQVTNLGMETFLADPIGNINKMMDLPKQGANIALQGQDAVLAVLREISHKLSGDLGLNSAGELR